MFSAAEAGQKQLAQQPLMLRLGFLILKISNYFLDSRIHIRLSVILKTSNKMVFEMVLQMVFIPYLFTVKTYGKN